MHTNEITEMTYKAMLSPALTESLQRVDEYWAGKSLRDVKEEMPEPTIVPIDDMRDVAVVEVSPNFRDHDESRDILLALPYLNGYTPHHYIRAKTLQLLAAPNHTVWLLPNSIGNKPAYTFTFEEKARLAKGSMQPLGEVQTAAFDRVSAKRPLGAVSLTGYSQGALTALAIAGVNQTSFAIERVNADEAPSVTDRNARQLSKDFMKSSRLLDLKGAVKDAGVRPLSQAMNARRLGLDLARFAYTSTTDGAKLLNEAMTGSANELVRRALRTGTAVKLGYIAGSSLFDPSSITHSPHGLRIVEYSGLGFQRKHATGDNVKLHAIMAEQGLRR